MKIIGLTGGIASGKSTVCRMITRRNIPLIDTDLLARQIIEPGKPAYKRVVNHFTREILNEDGTIDRVKLGEIIFSNEDKRKILNKCTHPFIRMEILKLVICYWIKGEKMVVVDVPLLIETRFNKFMSSVVVVYCSDQIQINRLIKRDNFSELIARQRINSQLPLKEKIKYANYIIENSGDIKTTEEQVENVFKNLKPSSLNWLLSWLGPPILAISLIIKGLLFIIDRL
ncbi:23569_t:CDS:2 [Dentiscutata erythropus]|uniref:23569_t:CDS:1 n=1 Tax=Dentiscutata erythropus TaxID=1348616 RepID=A0A9N9JP28_9GLOM|nr:23569_t:CDS:2 [Dentiscutata erythropus]